jgi:hypothetical protein
MRGLLTEPADQRAAELVTAGDLDWCAQPMMMTARVSALVRGDDLVAFAWPDDESVDLTHLPTERWNSRSCPPKRGDAAGQRGDESPVLRAWACWG